MVFSSLQFIALFLPIVLGGSLIAQRLGDTPLKLWLIGASLAFYAVWHPPYLLVLLGSIVVNFVLLRAALAHPPSSGVRLAIVTAGICGNIILLGWFKYAGFIAFNFNALFDSHLFVPQFLLPLGISFFTFQKIALLVDVYRREVTTVPFLSYLMFVTFFPQLIAGPIVLYPDVQRQYTEPGHIRISGATLSLGITIFIVGLFKKAVVADLMGTFAGPVFSAAADGKPLGTAEAWTGALAYTMQLYFDFSGYSDMALGLAAMFGVLLPFNFLSPYRATSIIEFWRRWHITLSRFLRAYLYIPLGGNRRGPARRYGNLLIVMLIGGLWHGAAWTFVVWGALHGSYLVVNHLWRSSPLAGHVRGAGFAAASWFVTFLAVVVGWVFFRADSLNAATLLLQQMFSPAGWAEFFAKGYPQHGPLELLAIFQFYAGGTLYIPIAIACALALCLIMPNTRTLFELPLARIVGGSATLDSPKPRLLSWEPSRRWATITGLLLAASLMAISSGTSPFLYFNF